ncbi:hypothetical protein, partial [Pseudomonas syringae group genomosp. 7]
IIDRARVLLAEFEATDVEPTLRHKEVAAAVVTVEEAPKQEVSNVHEKPETQLSLFGEEEAVVKEVTVPELSDAEKDVLEILKRLN